MTGAKKRAFPLAQVYGLLESGPVVMVTTAAGSGEHHVHVVAYDDGVRAAAGGLRDQRPELLV